MAYKIKEDIQDRGVITFISARRIKIFVSLYKRYINLILLINERIFLCYLKDFYNYLDFEIYENSPFQA